MKRVIIGYKRQILSKYQDRREEKNQGASTDHLNMKYCRIEWSDLNLGTQLYRLEEDSIITLHTDTILALV